MMVVFKIREGILLGSENDALMVDKRRKCAQVVSPVTHILSVTNQPPEWEKACLYGEICTLHIEASDTPTFDLLPYFNVCIDFIEGARKTGCVLVHCMYGVSRSVTVIAAYLMKSEQLSCAGALQSIANVKPSIKPNPGFMRQLQLWQEMKCCIDLTHKSYKSYRLGKMAKQMKETGQVEALCASHDPTFSSHDHDAVYKCRRCRKLLFTHEDVLPHEVGVGSSFTHSHNQRSGSQRKEEEITSKTISASISNHPLLEDATDHNKEETDFKKKFVHDVQQLNIGDKVINNSASVGELKGAAPHGEDDRSNGGVTFIVPVNSSTTLQSTRHFPMATTAAVGNHGNCTSVFIDVVEWLSPLVTTGQLEGKIPCPKCSARLGSFNWSGARCSCGQWITPSFQIHKSKIDQCLPLKTLSDKTDSIANSN